MARYRIIRYMDRYDLQKWFDRWLWYSPGWYTYALGDWRDGPVGYLGSVHEGLSMFERDFVWPHLPRPDPEPMLGFGPEGEALRAAAGMAGNDAAPKLIFADWLEENGYPNTAVRTRTSALAVLELATKGEVTLNPPRRPRP